MAVDPPKPSMISLRQARDVVVERTTASPVEEEVPLHESLGRRLASEFRAQELWPTTDRSAMDGFALSAPKGVVAGTVMSVVGESLAGHPFEGCVGQDQAIRIMTGAVVSGDVDTVVRVEDTSGFGGESVTFTQDVPSGSNIRPAGSEIAVGDLLLARGAWIRAAEIGALAVLGKERVKVFRRPRVAILSTGDEVVPIGADPQPHQLRDSNSHALQAQVHEAGGTAFSLGIGKDDPEDMEARIRKGLEEADVLLTIGGVSKGTHDLVGDSLAKLGVEQVFWGVALKPGKPSFFGVRHDGDRVQHVFGLPGNPASCFTVFDLLVRPCLSILSGGSPVELRARASLEGVPFRKNWRTQAIPARFSWGDDGGLKASVEPARPSGDPFGLVGGDGYVLIPPDVMAQDVDVTDIVFYGSGFKNP